ncbi:hypothetical protein BV898_20145, partial [Hypsibius exemplaris]
KFTSDNIDGSGKSSFLTRKIAIFAEFFLEQVLPLRALNLRGNPFHRYRSCWQYDGYTIDQQKSHFRVPHQRSNFGCCIDDPRTRKGRRMQLVKILGMAAIPIVVLVIQASLSIYGAILQMNYARSFRDQVRFCTEAGAVVHAMALERGTTTFYVSIPDEELLRTVYQK